MQQTTAAHDMAGFVIVSADDRWSINSVGWRAVFEPVGEHLDSATAAGDAVTHSLRGGLHYLDLTDASDDTKRAIGHAVRRVREDCASRPSEWHAAFPLDDFLATVDELIELLKA